MYEVLVAMCEDVCSHWWIPVLIGGFLFSRVDSCSHWWMPVLIGGFLFSWVDSCSHWWIPVLIGGFLFSSVDSRSHWWIPGGGACERACQDLTQQLGKFLLENACSRWWMPVLIGGFLFSLADSCSH
jgi:hypothetical protein